MIYLIIGFRNIIKNLRKSLLTFLTICFGLAALFVYSGSNTQMFRQFRDYVINKQYGSFQIHFKGYGEFGKKYPFDYLITNYSKIAGDLMKIKGIGYLAPRLWFTGIISGDSNSTVVKGFACDPEAESKMEYGKIDEGDFLDSGPVSEAVLGFGAIRKLSGKTGDTFTILSGMKNGGFSGIDLKITGIKKGYGESDIMNNMLIIAKLKNIQKLEDVPDSADTVIVQLEKDGDFSKVEKELAGLCGIDGLEYKRWDDLAVFYQRAKDVFDMNETVLTCIILLISVFIIINTMYMNFMERIREIGTVRALGTTRGQVGRIFISESIAIGIIGGLSGIILGIIAAIIIDICGGIYHAPTVFNKTAYYTLIRPDAAVIFIYWVLFIFASVISAVVTSLRAAGLSIADALRWN